jgi:hypothetical protein
LRQAVSFVLSSDYTVKFIGFTEAPDGVLLHHYPNGLEVPNVSEYGDQVIITFRCEQGLLEKGKSH